jgi:hypothetical protein
MRVKQLGMISLLTFSVSWGLGMSSSIAGAQVVKSGRPYATCKEHPDATGCRTKGVTTSGGGTSSANGATSNGGSSTTAGTSSNGGSSTATGASSTSGAAGGGQGAAAGTQSVVTGVSYGKTAGGAPGVSALPTTGGATPAGNAGGLFALFGGLLLALGLALRRVVR